MPLFTLQPDRVEEPMPLKTLQLDRVEEPMPLFTLQPDRVEEPMPPETLQPDRVEELDEMYSRTRIWSSFQSHLPTTDPGAPPQRSPPACPHCCVSVLPRSACRFTHPSGWRGLLRLYPL